MTEHRDGWHRECFYDSHEFWCNGPSSAFGRLAAINFWDVSVILNVADEMDATCSDTRADVPDGSDSRATSLATGDDAARVGLLWRAEFARRYREQEIEEGCRMEVSLLVAHVGS